LNTNWVNARTVNGRIFPEHGRLNFGVDDENEIFLPSCIYVYIYTRTYTAGVCTRIRGIRYSNTSGEIGYRPIIILDYKIVSSACTYIEIKHAHRTDFYIYIYVRVYTYVYVSVLFRNCFGTRGENAGELSSAPSRTYLNTSGGAVGPKNGIDRPTRGHVDSRPLILLK